MNQEERDDIIIENMISTEEESEDDMGASLLELGYFCQKEKKMPREGFDRLRVTQDKRLIKKVNVINAKNSNFEQAIIGLNNVRHDSFDIGNDLILHEFEIFGNYITFNAYVIEYQDYTIEYQIRYDGYEELFRQEYFEVIKAEVICDYDHLRYRKWNMNHLSMYREIYPHSFWHIPTIGYRDRRHEAVEYFSSYVANESERIGIAHVEWSFWKKAMDHVRYMIVNEDIEALESIIESHNQQGRIISAATLEYLQKERSINLSSAIIEKIKSVYQMDGTKIKTGITASHWGIVPTFVDIRKEFKQYLINK